MADKSTGLTVTLPLVWRGNYLFPTPMKFALGSVIHGTGRKWFAVVYPMDAEVGRERTCFPTLCAAKRAVEEAVMKALKS